MYNKLFTKILDSSIWLEPPGTRIVWLTLIAAMDEDGFCQFASVANLAHRARIPNDETEAAVKCLESPDKNSSDPEFDGRRIERVPGGWVVLNSPKYRDIVTRVIAKEQTRLRVARFRAKGKAVTKCNANVTTTNGLVTPSDTATATTTETIKERDDSLDDGNGASNRPSLAEFTKECFRYSIPDFYAEEKFKQWDTKNWRSGKTPVAWKKVIANYVVTDYGNDGRPLTKEDWKNLKNPTKKHDDLHGKQSQYGW